jgi:hypothetical protein
MPDVEIMDFRKGRMSVIYGPAGVVGNGVMDGVWVSVGTGVIEGVWVAVGKLVPVGVKVNEGVTVGVEVKVLVGGGMNAVAVTVLVKVNVAVGVNVAVFVIVPVTIRGVPLSVAVGNVPVGVMDGVHVVVAEGVS